MKLPRKLKKRLKNQVLSTIDPAWESHELRIKSYNMYRGKKRVTAYSLGVQ